MNRNMKNVLIGFCIALSVTQSTSPITLLYNMKIRRVFSGARQILEQQNKPIWVFTTVPVVFTRKHHFCETAPLVDIHEKRLVVGSVFDLRCALSKNSWFEITTAVANEQARAKGVSENPVLPVCSHLSRTGMDDVILAAGYHLYPTEDMQLDFYVITGFPTHTIVSRDDALGAFVGTRFFSLGTGGEFSYSFIQQDKRSLISILQARYLHFFSRSWDPVLPCGSTIQPGDIVDLLGAIRYREKTEIFETGYNPTFFLNQAATTPAAGKIRSDNFVLHGVYLSYAHVFLGRAHPLVLGAGFSFNGSTFLDARAYVGWIDFSIVF